MTDTTPATPSAGPARLAYLDNLRVLVVVLVVGMHSNVTYSGLGGWYYTEVDSDDLSLPVKIPFALYGTFTQAWFMGCLFLIAGYFAARSSAKKSLKAFATERLVRLGVPLAVYVFVITPFIGYALLNSDDVRGSSSIGRAYRDFLTSLDWIGGTGPMWFVEALLGMSLVYALVRRVRPGARSASPLPQRTTTQRTLIVAMAVTAAGAYCLRIPFPLGTDVANLQFGFFASYVVLFVLGTRIGETDGLAQVVDVIGRPWFDRVMTWGLGAWAVVIGAILASGNVDALNGGGTWQSVAFAVWESFVAIAMSFGLLSLFGRRCRVDNRTSRFLAENAFGLYMLHAPVLIAISLAVKDWDAPTLAKHACVWPLAVIATLAITAVLRRIPVVARVLK